MKTIEDKAHEYAVAMLQDLKCVIDAQVRANIAYTAFELAEAMQVEAEKRKAKGEWQPDWSQAPETAIAWEMRYGSNDEARWLHDHDKAGFSYSVAPTFNYQGDWKDSLRKRP